MKRQNLGRLSRQKDILITTAGFLRSSCVSPINHQLPSAVGESQSILVQNQCNYVGKPLLGWNQMNLPINHQVASITVGRWLKKYLELIWKRNGLGHLHGQTVVSCGWESSHFGWLTQEEDHMDGRVPSYRIWKIRLETNYCLQERIRNDHEPQRQAEGYLPRLNI